jgi:hypothetical protein
MDHSATPDEEWHGEDDGVARSPLFDHDFGGARRRYTTRRRDTVTYIGSGPSRSSTNSSSRSMVGMYPFEPFEPFEPLRSIDRPTSPCSESSLDTTNMCEPADVTDDTEGLMANAGRAAYSNGAFPGDYITMRFWEDFYTSRHETGLAGGSRLRFCRC